MEHLAEQLVSAGLELDGTLGDQVPQLRLPHHIAARSIRDVIDGRCPLPALDAAELYSLPSEERESFLDGAVRRPAGLATGGYSEVLSMYVLHRCASEVHQGTLDHIDLQCPPPPARAALLTFPATRIAEVEPNRWTSPSGGTIPMMHETLAVFWRTVASWSGLPVSPAALASWYAEVPNDRRTSLIPERSTTEQNAALGATIDLDDGFVVRHEEVACARPENGFRGHPGWMGRSYGWTLAGSGVGAAFRTPDVDMSVPIARFQRVRSEFMDAINSIAGKWAGT